MAWLRRVVGAVFDGSPRRGMRHRSAAFPLENMPGCAVTLVLFGSLTVRPYPLTRTVSSDPRPLGARIRPEPSIAATHISSTPMRREANERQSELDVSSVSVNAASYAFAPTQAAGTRHPLRRAAVDAAAQFLEMTPADVRSALQGGQSLSDLARTKGVSQDDLVNAMATAIKQANPNMSADRATVLATDIATQVPQQPVVDATSGASARPVGGHHHHGHHGGGAALMAASDVLGESTDDVATALRSGQSLADIASTKGISKDDLIGGIAAALQKANPNLSADAARQRATDFATAVPGAGSYLSVEA